MYSLRRAATAVAAGAMITVLAASAASAKTVTRHYFSKGVYSRLSDAAGNKLPNSASPAPGDRLSFASNDYAGNHKKHARKATASDHVTCTVMTNTSALCDGTIAIGGSMIIGDDFTLNFTATTTKVKITGGTGRFRHAHGTVIVKTVGNNNDLTIKVTT